MRTNVLPVAQQFLGAKKEAYQPYPHTGFLNVKIGGTLIAQFPVGSGPHSTLKSLKTPLKWYYIPMRICTISPDLGIWNFQIWTLLTTKIYSLGMGTNQIMNPYLSQTGPCSWFANRSLCNPMVCKPHTNHHVFCRGSCS